VCLADDTDAPHEDVLAVNPSADAAMLAETVLAGGILPHAGANAAWWFAAGDARVALGFRARVPFVRIARTAVDLRAEQIIRIQVAACPLTQTEAARPMS
jgi:hypothetical protein